MRSQEVAFTRDRSKIFLGQIFHLQEFRHLKIFPASARLRSMIAIINTERGAQAYNDYLEIRDGRRGLVRLSRLDAENLAQQLEHLIPFNKRKSSLPQYTTDR